MSLSGKLAIVTGGNKGIGAAISKQLSYDGATVIAMARGTGVDVTDSVSVSAAISQAALSHGNSIDLLINNAGGAIQFGWFDELDLSVWHAAYDLNVLSIVRTVKASLPYMKAGARIINIGSISGRQPGRMNPHYACSKAAVENLSKFLSGHLAKRGILVNTVCPGSVANGTWEKDVAHASREAEVTPLGRIGQGKDVAGIVSFLCSEKAEWITGSTFHVNGGKIRCVV